ncbi:hypothetical protein NIES4075_62440 [Tolypothrix sp. NIES-4075]|nr:hypothetical protein NIES4075_62440 [Tolypothrix sp. NIES-4075]
MNYALPETFVETRNFASLHSFLEMSIAYSYEQATNHRRLPATTPPLRVEFDCSFTPVKSRFSNARHSAMLFVLCDLYKR